MPIRRPALLVLIVGACAAQEPALALGVGPTVFADRDSRRLIQGSDGYDFKEDHGWKGVLGMSAPERAIFGYPWVDFDWSRTKGEGNRIDSVGTYYMERVPLGSMFYLGAGLGSVYENLRLETPTGKRRDDEWTFGGKAVVGLALYGPLYVEGSYQYNIGTTLGVETDLYGVIVGLRF
ncbi:MAG: hypothetical protein H0W72_12340 [Planctomycetes bacterium]|nr:hypothetical protein [Planctomycetota bacterium]